MKKAIAMLVFVACILSGCAKSAEIDKIKQIQFKDRHAGETARENKMTSAQIGGISLAQMEAPETVLLYHVQTRNYAYESKEVQEIASFLNIPYEEIEVYEGDGNVSSSISFDSSDAIFTMLDGYLLQYQRTITEEEQAMNVSATQDELIAKAEEIIEQIPYLDGEYQFDRMGERSWSSDTETCTYMRTCKFRRVIDGMTVYGGGGCDVGFTENGFCYLRVTYYDYTPRGDFETISPKTASASIQKPQVFYTTEGIITADAVAELEVQNCELVYDNECVYGYDTIQPFYRLEGVAYSERGSSDTFALYIPALQDKYFE